MLAGVYLATPCVRMKTRLLECLYMTYYFVKDLPGRKGNRTTISSVLSPEYKDSTGLDIDSL